MYPVKLGFGQAVARINALLANGHSAEGLLTAVFTFEKTLRRSLKYCIVARGFTSKQADEIIGHRGFKDLMSLWPCFAPNHETLPTFVGKQWQHVQPAVTKRNKMVHGAQVFKLSECDAAAKDVLAALQGFQTALQQKVGFDGWSKIKVRRSSRVGWCP